MNSELAQLVAAAKMKVLRANNTADSGAIIADYFHQSVAVMRRVGLAINVAPGMRQKMPPAARRSAERMQQPSPQTPGQRPSQTLSDASPAPWREQR